MEPDLRLVNTEDSLLDKRFIKTTVILPLRLLLFFGVIWGRNINTNTISWNKKYYTYLFYIFLKQDNVIKSSIELFKTSKGYISNSDEPF